MGELERSLTHREFLEWKEFHRTNPFGPQQDDFRVAILAALVGNMFRDKSDKPLAPWDVMPWLEHADATVEKEDPTPEEVSANVLKHFFPPHMATNANTLLSE